MHKNEGYVAPRKASELPFSSPIYWEKPMSHIGYIRLLIRAYIGETILTLKLHML